MARPPRILLSAGESSGDRLGAGLARALRERIPDVDLAGMGGPEMARAGVRLVQQSSEVAVVGILEVLSHLGAIRGAMRRLSDTLAREQPDLLVPIDFPDFNLRLAARARRAGVPVVYFVSPQVWAWRRGRVRQVQSLARRMLVLFPFEVEFYEKAGMPVTFVGHPLAEQSGTPRSREVLAAAAGLDPERDIVALLPGSRRLELGRILPPMLEAASRIRLRRPGTQFLVSQAPGLSRQAVESLVRRAAVPDVRIHAGDFPEILSVCAAGAVASGTASLEAAVMGLPIVVVYRMHPLTYAIGRSLVRIDDVALPNLIAGRRVVPELIQRACTGEAIAGALLRYLEEPAEAQRVRGEFVRVRERLGGEGAFARAADQVLAELESVQGARIP